MIIRLIRALNTNRNLLGGIRLTRRSRLTKSIDELFCVSSGLLQPDKGLPSDSALNSNIISLKRLSLSTPNSCCPPKVTAHHVALSHHIPSASHSYELTCLASVSPPEHKLHKDSGLSALSPWHLYAFPI